MFIDFLKSTFEKNSTADAIVWKEQIFKYQFLLDRTRFWNDALAKENVQPGTVVIIDGDFSPNGIALFLSLLERGCILVPLTAGALTKKKEYMTIAQGEVMIFFDENDEAHFERRSCVAHHDMYDRLRDSGHPGLVIFSSGSTGEAKASLHDLSILLEKFKKPGHRYRTITFLFYDHIGGFNTMLYTLANAGCLITLSNRFPDYVLSMVEKFKAELLPTSPTFLNLMILSEAYKNYDLSSLKKITYGTEPMLEKTLKRLHEILPQVDLLQTYGLTEIGILQSRSKSSESLWVKVGGEGFQTRVMNGCLQIKARSAMIGYLNALSPFTDDGWLETGDSVEQDGEYIKILGRKSEVINVGGQKVFPAEVENVIYGMANVMEVSVYGEKNMIVGNIVCARVNLVQDEDTTDFVARLKKHCRSQLETFKVPVKVFIVKDRLFSEKFKKKHMFLAQDEVSL